VVNPQIWQNIPHKQVRRAVILSNPEEDAGGHEKARVAKCNELRVFGLIKRARRIKVVYTIAEAILLPLSATLDLSLVEVMTGHIGEQICRPATKLLTNEVESCGNGGLLGKLVDLVQELAII
jgi:hypothetical protein